MNTQFNLTEAEARGILSDMDLDFDAPDEETHDREGIIASWNLDDERVIVFYSNGDGVYSITRVDR